MSATWEAVQMRLIVLCYLLSPYQKSHVDQEVFLTGNSGRVSEQYVELRGFRIHEKVSSYKLS